MVGLGILAAGAAQGAANASNMNVQAQNQLEMQDMQHGRDLQRDALREEFLNRRFDKEVAIGRENAKAAGILRDMEYQRNRADKQADSEAEFKRRLQLEGIKESGRNARADKRIAAMNAAGEGRNASDKGILLPNGEIFVPNDADSKAAANFFKLGLVADMQEGYQRVHALRLSGQAATSMEGLGKTTADAAMALSGNLLGKQKQEQSVLKEWNPKTGKFE